MPPGSTDTVHPEVEEPQPRKSKKGPTDQDFARKLIRQLKQGMKKMRKREAPFDPFAPDQLLRPEQNKETEPLKLMQAVHTKLDEMRGWGHQCLPEHDVEACLDDLDKSLMGAEEEAKKAAKEAGVRQWWFWYFSACIRIIRQDRREGDRDRKADGAYVLHRVVNELLVTEGVKALAVIAAAAGKKPNYRGASCGISPVTEQSCRLSAAAYASHERQRAISALVAAGLRGQVDAPPDHYRIPIATMTVSVVTRVR